MNQRISQSKRWITGIGLALAAVTTPVLAAADEPLAASACESLKTVLRSNLERAISDARTRTASLASVLLLDNYTTEDRLLLKSISQEQRKDLLFKSLHRRNTQTVIHDGKEKNAIGVCHVPRTIPIDSDPERTYMDELLLDRDECSSDAACRMLVKQERGRRYSGKTSLAQSDYFVEFPAKAHLLRLQRHLQRGDVNQNLLNELPIESSDTSNWQQRELRLSSISVSLDPVSLENTIRLEGMIHGLENDALDGSPSPRGHAVSGSINEIIYQVYLPQDCRDLEDSKKKEKRQALYEGKTKELLYRAPAPLSPNRSLEPRSGAGAAK